MAALHGRLFLVSIGSGGSPETFAPVLTARSNSISINSETVDVSNKSTDGWRKLLEGAGMKTMSISLEGTFENTAAEKGMIDSVMSGDFGNFKVTDSEDNEFVGSFHVTQCDMSGTFNGEQTFSVSMESAGQITFTAGV